ncbi:ent-kaur-16-ene synthase, chloroplastic [Dorcoceras hygrometricum]|uniref:Ent-kaur-16-ene synthase, chloroplastic n=1 Tax=Dorcoceras hygrometricum TaxID=472368 RepID=A0A2Z7DGM4_9LAMI|nr:ent-kaur-16-ene synthase, chloroplastic [Dorcoceras hygrometricum]
MVKRLETSPHDPLGITDSACKNQLVVVSVQYGPFNTYIPIRSTTIGISRVAKDPIAMHTSWRSNSDIVSVTRVSMTFRVVKTNQYNQDLGLIHSTNGNHLESPNEGSSIDHQVTIHLHAQNITMLPTNERIMVKRLATSRHDPLGITDSSCKKPVGRDSSLNLGRPYPHFDGPID